MDRAKKKQIIAKYQKHAKDTGSAAVQIAILSFRISYLTGHLQTHKKDDHSRRGLIQMVNQRRKLLDYLSQNKPDTYKQLVADEDLGIRK